MADLARSERLKELRLGHPDRPSQDAMADVAGVSGRAYFEWEHGGGIKWEHAKKLAEFFGVEPESLVTRDLEDERLARMERLLVAIADHLGIEQDAAEVALDAAEQLVASEDEAEQAAGQ